MRGKVNCIQRIYLQQNSIMLKELTSFYKMRICLAHETIVISLREYFCVTRFYGIAIWYKCLVFIGFVFIGSSRLDRRSLEVIL